MDAVTWLVEAARAGIPLADMTAAIAWEQLALEDREALLGQVRRFWTTEPETVYRLLQALFGIARDPWYRLEILSLVIQHPDCQPESMKRTLDTMRILLRSQKPAGKNEIVMHQRYQAVYHFFKGKLDRRAGEVQTALDDWRAALGLFQAAGLEAQAARVQAEIDRLHQESGPAPRPPAPAPAAPAPGEPRRVPPPVLRPQPPPVLRPQPPPVLRPQPPPVLRPQPPQPAQPAQPSPTPARAMQPAEVQPAPAQPAQPSQAQLGEERLRLQTEIQGLEKKLAGLQTRQASLDADLQRKQAELAEARGQLAQAEAALLAQRQQLAELQQERERQAASPSPANNGDHTRLQAQLQQAQQRISLLEGQLAEHKKKVLPPWAPGAGEGR